MRFPTFLVAIRHCLTSHPLTLLVFQSFFLEEEMGRFISLQSLSYCSFQIIFPDYFGRPVVNVLFQICSFIDVVSD